MAKAMKDSGVAWIGEIPDGWKIRRIKTLFKLRDEKNYKPLSEVNLISLYTDKGVMQHSDIEYFAGNKASNADGYKCVYENDIVVNIILCWMGAIGRSAYNGVTSPAYDVYFPLSFVNSNYYHYLFRTNGFNGECFKRGRGIMLMRWRTYSDDFSNISVPFPPLPQQQSIANFLDKKCSELDSILTKIRESIEEYKKLKQSIITQAVTKGIRPNRKMKDSGIEWIGEIPEEWEIKQVKYLADYNKKTLTEETDSNFEFEYIDIGSVINGEGITTYEKMIFSNSPSRARRIVKNEDVILSTVRTYLRAAALIQERELPLIVSTGFIVLTAKIENIIPQFLYYGILADYFIKLVEASSVGISYPAINASQIVNFKIVFPHNKEEQQEIAKYLDKKYSEIDNLISKKEQLVTELETYKKSLIYEYVTGKKEVK